MYKAINQFRGMSLLISFIKLTTKLSYLDLMVALNRLSETDKQYMIKILFSINKRTAYYIGNFSTTPKQQQFLFNNCINITNNKLNLEYFYIIYNSILKDLKITKFILTQLASDFAFDDVIIFLSILNESWNHPVKVDNELNNILSNPVAIIEPEISTIIGSNKYINLFYLGDLNDQPFGIKNKKLRNTIQKYIKSNYSLSTRKTQLLYKVKSLYYVHNKNHNILKVSYKQGVIIDLLP